jgi:hypothetical protein
MTPSGSVVRCDYTISDRVQGDLIEFLGFNQCLFCLLPRCDVFNSKKNQWGLVRFLNQLAGIQQHGPAADLRKVVCNWKITELAMLWQELL